MKWSGRRGGLMLTRKLVVIISPMLFLMAACRTQPTLSDVCNDDPVSAVVNRDGLELSEGERYEAIVVFDSAIDRWWPVRGLHLPHHHSAAIDWRNLDSFEAFADRSARVRLSFRVRASETTFYEQQYRWATIYACEILEAKRCSMGSQR